MGIIEQPYRRCSLIPAALKIEVFFFVKQTHQYLTHESTRQRRGVNSLLCPDFPHHFVCISILFAS